MEINTLPLKLAKLPGTLLSRAGVFIGILDLLATGHLLSQGTSWMDLGVHAVLTLGLTMAGFELVKRTVLPGKSRWNAWITASILFLILHPGMTQGDWAMAAACALACAAVSVVLSALTFRKGKTWLNPVVVALMLVTLGAKAVGDATPFISWWGTGFGTWGQSWIWVSIWTVIVVTEWRKWPSLLGFLAVMLSLNTASFFTNSTLFFLGAVMLVEPKTSPFRTGEQFVYGLLAGFALVGLGRLGISHADLWSILFANALFTTGLLGKIIPKPTPKLAPKPVVSLTTPPAPQVQNPPASTPVANLTNANLNTPSNASNPTLL